MGVTGDVLKRILRTAGRKVELTKYKHGISDEPLEKPSSKRQRLRPLRVGLDISNWISRVAHGNGGMLVDDRYLTNYGRSKLERGEETEVDLLTSEENRRNYVELCAKRVLSQIQNLEHNSKVDILVVFDGASPPIKKQEVKRRRAKTQEARRLRDARNKEENNETLERRIRAGRAAGAGACYGAIIQELLQLLREAKISFMVAPYEADGQLAYLCDLGAIDIVITEDSDLLCQDIPAILFKYEWDGSGILVQRCDLGAAELKSRTLCLMDFSTTMLAVMFACIGCDYCRSLQGIGSVTARNIVREVFVECKNTSKPVLQSVIELLYANSRYKVNKEEKEEYEASFLGALFMYEHPIIFSLTEHRCILAKNPPHGSDPLLLEYEPYALLCQDPEKQHELVGSIPERRLQVAIIEGWINPCTFEPYPNVVIPQDVLSLLNLDKSARSGLLDSTIAVGERNSGNFCKNYELVYDQRNKPKMGSEQIAAEDTQESRYTPESPEWPETQPGTHLFSSDRREKKDSSQQYQYETQSSLAETSQVYLQQPSQESSTQQPSQTSDEKEEDGISEIRKGIFQCENASSISEHKNDQSPSLNLTKKNNISDNEKLAAKPQPRKNKNGDAESSDATKEYPYELKTSSFKAFLSPLQHCQQSSQCIDDNSNTRMSGSSPSVLNSQESHYKSQSVSSPSCTVTYTNGSEGRNCHTQTQSSATSVSHLTSQSSAQSSIKSRALLP